MSNNCFTRCSLETLKQRAFLLQTIRHYFDSQNVMEVETPVLSSAGNTDINIESFVSNKINNSFKLSYLRTSPEFPLKRLLASGVGDVYEIGKVFRKDEISRTHNIEFTLVEWYRLNFNYYELIQDVTRLFECILSSFSIDEFIVVILTFHQVFKKYLAIDLNGISQKQLNTICEKYNYSGSQLSKDQALDFLFATQIQTKFSQNDLTFITHYPASQAALSQIDPSNPEVSLRFEVFYRGFELGNGYQELTCSDELTIRFKQDNSYRCKNELPEIVIDEALLKTMKNMPKCSGIAMGVDRILMALIGKKKIKDVISFHAKNA